MFAVISSFSIASDDAVNDKRMSVGCVVKMRTELADCGGGSVMMTKSQQDVEAAFAIAQLSEQQPRRTDVHVRTTSPYKADSPMTNGSCQRHIRVAVMPHTSSRVERAAVKRRFDSSLDSDLSVKQARLQGVVDRRGQRTVESEQGSAIRQMTTTAAGGDNELVGRFVRTCGSSDGDDSERQLFVKVSDHRVSPTLVSSVPPSLFTARTSSERRVIGKDNRLPVLSSTVSDPSYRDQHRPAVRHDHTDALYFWDASKRGEYLPLIPAVNLPLCFEDSTERLKSRRTLKSSREDDVNRRHERLSSDRSLVSAFYNLGQTAAAAAASHLLFVKPTPVASHCSSAVSRCPDQLTSCQSSLRRVDTGTLDKVRRGEFGVLSTLRQYCRQLRRHSEPCPSDTATSTTRWTDDGRQSADGADVAVDLSVRKLTVPDDEHRSDCDVVRSRSCGSSPSVSERYLTVDRCSTQQRISSISLPSSPHTCRHDDRHTATVRRDDVTVTGGDVTELIADSRLPLKKRRLHYYQQQQQQQPGPLSVINENDADKRWLSTDCSDIVSHEASSASSSLSAAAAAAAASLSSVSEPEGPAERDDCSQSVFVRADEDGDLPLHIAVAKGTAAAVESIISVMLSVGISLDYCNNRHQTALHLAVLTNQPAIVRQLLDGGASSDVVDGRGQTCLHVAVLLDSTTCLRLLLHQSRRPLHVNAVSHDGVTALHLAVQRGNADAVRCLLSAGVDVNVVDKCGRTALFYALTRNDVAVTQLLMSFGAISTTSAATQAVYSSKCSTDILQLIQPAMSYRQLPACCPTG